MGTLALIGLGSNLGDRKANLDGAVETLGRVSGIAVHAVSSYHETKPVGGPGGQGAFLNASAAIETALEPLALLRRLHQVEASTGRVRTVRWGERTLDLDLLLYGDAIVDTPELTVPHPRMAVRRFVLAPLEEIAPDCTDPLTGRSIQQLRENLDRRPSYLALEGWWKQPEKRQVLERLVAELNTGCWSQTDLERFVDRGCLAGAVSLLFGPLEKSLEFLATRDRQIFGNRWIVTDFTVDDLAADAHERWGPLEHARPGSLTSQHARRTLDLIEPTFIVAGHRGPHRHADAGAILRSTPRLVPRPGNADTLVAEILAACTATRT